MVELPYVRRPELLESVMTVLTTRLKQGVTLFAPRTKGKTWFVRHELIPAAKKLRWQVVYVDLWSNRNEPEIALVEGLEDQGAPKSGLFQTIKLSKVGVKVKPPAVEFGAEFEPEAKTKRELTLSRRLRLAMDKLVDHSKSTTLLVIDEFQTLAKTKNNDFVAAFRTAIQAHQGKLVIVYTGSSRAALMGMFTRQKAPLFDSAFPIDLPDLGREFIEDRVKFIATRSGRKVPIDKLEQVFKRVDRSPQAMNEIVLQILVSGDPEPEAAFKVWLEKKRAETSNRLNDLSALELIMLSYLARDDEDRHSTYSSEAKAELANIAGFKSPLTTSQVQSTVKKLERKDLIVPTEVPGAYEVSQVAIWSVIRESPLMPSPSSKPRQ